MEKEKLRANRQKALIQDTLYNIFSNQRVSEGPTIHPFIHATQTLRRELDFMEPMRGDEGAQGQLATVLKSAESVLENAEQQIFSDNQVSPEATNLQPLVEFHTNLLKIHRLILTRAVEGDALIPPAPLKLQSQVEKIYEALGGLDKVISTVSKVPKKTQKRKTTSRSAKTQREEEIIPPLEFEYRVSPFITDGAKKGTVSIDGVIWQRYV